MKKCYFVFLLTLIGCSTPKQITNEYFVEDIGVNLYAFVGEKISVVEFDPNEEIIKEKIYDSISGETIIRKKYIMDSGFRCKYAIIKNVFNNPQVDTIDFVAYDHYGKPAFSKYKNALLYISKSSNGNYFFHQKYQFDYLEKNNEGKFYGYTYDKKIHKNQIIYKNKKIADVKKLFVKKKEEVFKQLFERKNGN